MTENTTPPQGEVEKVIEALTEWAERFSSRESTTDLCSRAASLLSTYAEDNERLRGLLSMAGKTAEIAIIEERKAKTALEREIVAAYIRGAHWIAQYPGSLDYLNKAAGDYMDKRITALSLIKGGERHD